MPSCVLYDLRGFGGPSFGQRNGTLHGLSQDHLRCPRGEIFKGPPNPVIFLSLFNLFRDFHNEG